MVKELIKILNSNTSLSRQLETLLSAVTIDSSENNRIKSQINDAIGLTKKVELILSDISDRFKCEEATAKQQIWERKLLDLSLRNGLLNMRTGRNCVPFEAQDIANLEDELDMGKEFVLDSKELKYIYRAVRTNLEETGANTLFLTLGTLKWCERSGGKIYSAPILLVPVEMVAMKKGLFAIHKRDEDVMLNITLMEFLKQNYGISIDDINPLPKDAHGIDVSLVLYLVSEAIQEKPGWEVVEESQLGLFSFTKFVMWNDIHTHVSAMQANPLVRSFIEGRLLVDDSGKTEADARNMDVTLKPDAMAIPVDADSSQLEAVADAQEGRSFILVGPPGTGKSQTITNLIANALYHNKRVLFVAQKKAALDVVESRLAKIGLSPFCLELHSNKMDKHHFLQQMERSLQQYDCDTDTDYRKTSESLYHQRMKLTEFVNAMHSKRSSGYSLYDCVCKHLSIDAPTMSLPKDFCKNKTKEDIDRISSEIKSLDAVVSILGGKTPSEHPLHGFLPIHVQAERTAMASKFFLGDSLEAQLIGLPQSVSAIKQQIDRNRKIVFLNKTPRQYIVSDYKFRKFLQIAEVDDVLLDDIDALCDAANRWAENIDFLPQWQQYADKMNSLKQMGLEAAITLFEEGKTPDEICRSFLASFFKMLAGVIINSDENLCKFQGTLFEQIIDEYNKQTKLLQKVVCDELVVRLSADNNIFFHNPEIGAELTLLRRRIGNKGRGTTIRSIIDQMPNILSKLCPVMLMSPLSVAQYLDIDRSKFDLVVFDEASQMPTSEAVGAIARGRSVVVVGDPKQMPPTSFFSANTIDDEETDLDDMESVLDDCLTLSMPTRYLGWHYRSKHESLISFSNQNFYDNRLVTFPSADDMVSHVTWQHVEGVYDFGKTRTNRMEAEAIADEVITRIKSAPDRSIGIIAFSKAQSDLIEDLISERLSNDPKTEQLNNHSPEPMFVKNLENVQGDERDVILFSVCYGPDKDGRVSMNFGPLNKVGGERRLNVAITRARYEMKIFSTLTPEMIDERRTNADGVIGLKKFLAFAKNGNIRRPSADNKNDRDSILIDQIADRLRLSGYDIRSNVGSSILRVDIGIVDPNCQSKYILGIIIDGERYSKLKTARDREIVQPAVLNMLGWNLLHVWTIDWFVNPDFVLKNIQDKVSKIQKSSQRAIK